MLELAILGVLAEQPRHGYELKKRLSDTLGPLWGISFGSLYPALKRLELKGWIASKWETSEFNRRAKYYRITAAGKRQLAREHDRWNRLVKTIARIMRPA